MLKVNLKVKVPEIVQRNGEKSRKNCSIIQNIEKVYEKSAK